MEPPLGLPPGPAARSVCAALALVALPSDAFSPQNPGGVTVCWTRGLLPPQGLGVSTARAAPGPVAEPPSSGFTRHWQA